MTPGRGDGACTGVGATPGGTRAAVDTADGQGDDGHRRRPATDECDPATVQLLAAPGGRVQ
ncbi:MAG TPA: hypothetical protein VIZ43_05195, partial [Trebonia sp.]